MERVSQLILRNAGLLDSGQVLLINPPQDSCFSSLSQNQRRVQVFSQDFADYHYLCSSGATAEFGLIPAPAPAAQDIVLLLPRERERLDMLLHALASSMHPHSTLWLAGENRAGIKSSAKRLAQYFQSVFKVDNARHCTLFRARDPLSPKPFDLELYKKSWPVTSAIAQLKLITLPGTFAHGRLDDGTGLLLDTLQEQRPGGRVLDFACGNGIIGLSLLQFQPSVRLTLLDVSALALESARDSLRANGLEATLLVSDGLSRLEGRFDWIISNPPFHRGIRNDLEIAGVFFAGAGKFLTEMGKILLVCNHHLPYTSWLSEHFRQVDVIRVKRGFKVIRAQGSRN